MRLLLSVVLGLSACGGNTDVVDAAPVRLPGCETPIAGGTLSLRMVGRVDDAAMLVASPPLDPRRFVVEQSGAIRIFEDDALLPAPFLDVSHQIVAGGERGLLGLAFHPQYATTGQFFIFYTTSTANVVARCTVSADRNVANPACTTVLSIPDFAGNHNGGMMEFGKDGFLYIGTGDGGGGGDPQRTAQDPNRLLGKILRIDVDGRDMGKEYASPPTNPYVAGGGAPEVFILGLRNPWRWSFDKDTGDLWIGDVGQGQVEELTVLRAGEQLGKNLGWSIYEGASCCMTQGDRCSQTGNQAACNPTGLVMPQDKHSHAEGWISIIAGEVYRGTCYTDMVGWHFYTDYASQNAGLWKARLEADNSLEVVHTGLSLPNGTASIHADSRGELFLTTLSNHIYHIEAGP
ncbi:MAG: Glucose/sorbosone dehydrogenase-like protein [Myxococcales bacterium]|nr:Glucose/sorbosone dehydrogenase-like protein [Myxococcales bacterium]